MICMKYKFGLDIFRLRSSEVKADSDFAAILFYYQFTSEICRLDPARSNCVCSDVLLLWQKVT